MVRSPVLEGGGWGGGVVSSRFGEEIEKRGGSPSVWSVAPKGSSSRLALKARWAVQLKRAVQRRV